MDIPTHDEGFKVAPMAEVDPTKPIISRTEGSLSINLGALSRLIEQDYVYLASKDGLGTVVSKTSGEAKSKAIIEAARTDLANSSPQELLFDGDTRQIQTYMLVAESFQALDAINQATDAIKDPENRLKLTNMLRSQYQMRTGRDFPSTDSNGYPNEESFTESQIRELYQTLSKKNPD